MVNSSLAAALLFLIIPTSSLVRILLIDPASV